ARTCFTPSPSAVDPIPKKVIEDESRTDQNEGKFRTQVSMTIGNQDSSSLTIRTAWLMIAKTVGYAFSIALPLILVRRLDQNEFGLYKQVFLIVSSAVLVLPFGFHMSAYYYLPRERERKGQIVLNILL